MPAVGRVDGVAAAGGDGVRERRDAGRAARDVGHRRRAVGAAVAGHAARTSADRNERASSRSRSRFRPQRARRNSPILPVDGRVAAQERVAAGAGAVAVPQVVGAGRGAQRLRGVHAALLGGGRWRRRWRRGRSGSRPRARRRRSSPGRASVGRRRGRRTARGARTSGAARSRTGPRRRRWPPWMNRKTWWWPGARPRILSFTTWPGPRALTFLKRPVGTRASRSITITRTAPAFGARVQSTTEVSVMSPEATPAENDAPAAGAASTSRRGSARRIGRRMQSKASASAPEHLRRALQSPAHTRSARGRPPARAGPPRGAPADASCRAPPRGRRPT